MQYTSFVTFSVAGLHHWADAPDDVDYLRAPHRHVFHVKVTFSQPHSRAVEFHQFLAHCKTCLKQLAFGTLGGLYDFWGASCEEIAGMLAVKIVESGTFMFDELAVTVSEDGEAGSTAYVKRTV